MAGVYIHIPFCRRKCIYCDFYSVGERLAHWPEFVSALLAEAGRRLSAGPRAHFDTLYIGGGTPSLIPPSEFVRLAEGLRRCVGEVAEFTIEVNPDDVTPERAALWRECGVNRLSMGVQSLVDSELKAIGRRHDSATTLRAYEILRSGFDNISLDLMFGLPGQSYESLMYSVKGVVNLMPEHISVYSLMYEERTALTRMRDAGKLAEAPEDLSTQMFEGLSDALEAAGYEQYEISNYAQPGFRSLHNSAYWRGVPYLGLGPGAHSYDGCRMRCANNPDVNSYVAYWLSGKGERPFCLEELTEDELREEMIMTALRTREGIGIEEFKHRFGPKELKKLLAASERWQLSGCMIYDGNRVALTRKGIMISDEIISDLF